MYDVMSLGLSIDKEQQDLTGSPLFAAYLTAQELQSVARLISYGLASQDKVYLAKLAKQAASEDLTVAGIDFKGILNGLKDLDKPENKGKTPLDIIVGHVDFEVLRDKLEAAGLTLGDILKLLESGDSATNPEQASLPF